MASCNACKIEYWLDIKTGKKMDKDDHNKIHTCIGVAIPGAASGAAAADVLIARAEQKMEARNYYEEKEKKIEDLALKKIAALNRIADAIFTLAGTYDERSQKMFTTKSEDQPSDGNS
jgi:hypothetical protein